MKTCRLISVAVLGYLALSCAKKSELSFNDSASNGPIESFSCDQPGTPGKTDIQRLTKYELVNTITDIFGAAIVSEVSTQVSAIPQDNVVNLFDTIERSVSSSLIQSYFDLAVNLSAKAVATDARITALAGSCFTAGTLTNSCIDGFINQIGLKIFRRPLSSAEVIELRGFYLANASTRSMGLQMVLTDMLQAPDFLYRDIGL